MVVVLPAWRGDAVLRFEVDNAAAIPAISKMHARGLRVPAKRMFP